MKVEVETGRGAAWRARYLRINGTQRCYIGVDPNDGVTPQLFGGYFLHRELQGSFRIPLPTVRFKHPCSPLEARVYGIVRRFWHNMDGRYGWGSEYYKKRKAEERSKRKQ